MAQMKTQPKVHGFLIAECLASAARFIFFRVMNGHPCFPVISALLKGGATFYQGQQWGYKALPGQVRQNVHTCRLFTLPGDCFSTAQQKHG